MPSRALVSGSPAETLPVAGLAVEKVSAILFELRRCAATPEARVGSTPAALLERPNRSSFGPDLSRLTTPKGS